MSDRPELPDYAPDDARERLQALVTMLSSDPTAPSSVREPGEAWRVHVADSLSGLEFGDLRDAGAIADVGAGAGFPGLVLATVLPAASVDLIESIGRKCEFARAAAERARLANVGVLCERAESLGAEPPPRGRRGDYDVVTARAVGRLSTLAELASPLLREGGALIAWKGARDPDEEAELDRASERLAMYPEEVRWVGPYAGSRHRHLHLVRKRGETPASLPRRPGMAKKRPLGARAA